MPEYIATLKITGSVTIYSKSDGHVTADIREAKIYPDNDPSRFNEYWGNQCKFVQVNSPEYARLIMERLCSS